ncbi:hypothetical protein FHS94_002258 [Sphingomonas aerophila]|uniref:YozE SAM-like domain-containing protein n=1 Tax=Sphingomonas aerophila TaxID=1344948 RepID=A0A7W9BE06_9SPHN|nr:hypothetical protein [Sphingomonas aerophila]
MALTFKQFLRSRPATASDVGRFVSAARRDRRLGTCTCWKDLERYLLRIGAEPDARVAARKTWLAYEAADNLAKRHNTRPKVGKLAVTPAL